MRRSNLTHLLALPLLLTGVATTGAEVGAEAVTPTVAALALQDCGDWRYPMLCRVELRVNDGTSSWQDYDPDDRLGVPPRGDLDIEVSGRDQDGRSFPQDRLALGFDDRDCRGLLDVEQRDEGALRISARRPDGECRLDLYVPGDLNFAWRIDVQVRRDMATSYERDQAETIVRALYRGILGREVDAGSFAAAVSEIQRGNLEPQVAGMFAVGNSPRASPIPARRICWRVFTKACSSAPRIRPGPVTICRNYSAGATQRWCWRSCAPTSSRSASSGDHASAISRAHAAAAGHDAMRAGRLPA